MPKTGKGREPDVTGFEGVDEKTLMRELSSAGPITYSDYLRFLPLPPFSFRGGGPVPPSREQEREAERKALEEKFEELRMRCDEAIRPKTIH